VEKQLRLVLENYLQYNMTIDKDIQELVDNFIEEVNSYEGELTSFKGGVDEVIVAAKEKVQRLAKVLDEKFEEDNSMTEEDYLKLFREKKEVILKEVKDSLSALIKDLEQ